MSAHRRAFEEALATTDAMNTDEAQMIERGIRAYLTIREREGWKLVPTDATAAMQDAGAFSSISFSYGGDTNSFDYVSEEDAAAIYRKMLAAAPSPHDKEGEQ